MEEQTETVKPTIKPFTPFDNPSIEKPYVQELIDSGSGRYSEEELDIPVPEPVYKKPKITPAQAAEAAEAEEPKEPINPGFDDLPHSEKLALSEKGADAYIEAYSKFIPMIPIKISSFNMAKMKDLDLEGKLSLNMPITANNETVGQYMNGFNSEVERIFTVSEDVKASIRDPLIDVLMEKGMVPTPMQRLLLAVGMHMVQMTKSTVELVLEKRDNMKTFINFKTKEDARHAEEIRFRSTPQQPQQPQQPQPVTQNTEPITTKPEQKTEPPINTTVQEAQKNENKPEDDSIPFEEVEAPYTKPKVELTLDSYIDDDVIVNTSAND